MGHHRFIVRQLTLAEQNKIKQDCERRLVVVQKKYQKKLDAAKTARLQQEELTRAKKFVQLKKEAEKVITAKVKSHELSIRDSKTVDAVYRQYIVSHTQDVAIQIAAFDTETAKRYIQESKIPRQHKHHPASFWNKAFTVLKIVAVGIVATFVPPLAATIPLIAGLGTFGTVLATGAACALTDASAQLTGMGLGLQDKFSLNEVLETGVSVGVGTAAAGASMAVRVTASSAGGAGTQAAEIAIGTRDKFDLKSAAFQAGTAVVSSALNEALPKVNQILQKTIPQTVNAIGDQNIAIATSTVANTTAQSALGSLMMHTPMNLEHMVLNAVGSALGNKLGTMLNDQFFDESTLFSDVTEDEIDIANSESTETEIVSNEPEFDLKDMCLLSESLGETVELPNKEQMEAVFDIVEKAIDKLQSLPAVDTKELEALLPTAPIDPKEVGAKIVDELSIEEKINIITSRHHHNALASTDVPTSSLLDSFSPWQKVALATALTVGAVSVLPASVTTGVLTLLGRLGTALMSFGATADAIVLDSFAAEALGILPATSIGAAITAKLTQVMSRMGLSFFKSAPRVEIPLATKNLGEVEATNHIYGLRLQKQLEIEQTKIIFREDGYLTEEAIQNASPMGLLIKNPKVLEDLSKRAGNVEDWRKYATKSLPSPSGDFEVHFYRNPVTKDVYYDRDYKAIFQHQGKWNHPPKPNFDYEPPRMN